MFEIMIWYFKWILGLQVQLQALIFIMHAIYEVVSIQNF